MILNWTEGKVNIFTTKYLSRDSFLILINSDEWLLAFSVTRNVQDLLNTDENPNDIQTVHGIRFLNAIVLMFT